MKGVLVADIERCRESFAEELRAHVDSVEKAIRSTDVGALAQRFAEEVAAAHAREEETRVELAQQRRHVEELLRLNVELRQFDLSTNLENLKIHVRKLEESAKRASIIQERSETFLLGVERVEASAAKICGIVAPLQDANKFMETVVKGLEPKVADETRKGVASFLQPLMSAVRQGSLDTKFSLEAEVRPLKASLKGFRSDLREWLKPDNACSPDLKQTLQDHGKQQSSEMQVLSGSVAKHASDICARLESLEQQVSEESVKVHLATEALWKCRETTEVQPLRKDPSLPDMSGFLQKLEGNRELMAVNQRKLFEIGSDHERIIGILGDALERTQGNFEKVVEMVKCVPGLVALEIESQVTADEAEVRQATQEAQRLRRQVEKLKCDLDKEREKGKSMTGAPMLRKLLDIEDRKNVRIDYRSGDVEIIREIPFDPKRHDEEPLGEYVDEDVAVQVLTDVKDIWEVFKVSMTVEGHTKGGETEFWQALADNRAATIVCTLTDLGVDPAHLISRGLPGKKGLNKVGVRVKLDIFPDR